MAKITKALLPDEYRKRRRSVMISPHQEKFVESQDPTGAKLFPRGLANILAKSGWSPLWEPEADKKPSRKKTA